MRKVVGTRNSQVTHFCFGDYENILSDYNHHHRHHHHHYHYYQHHDYHYHHHLHHHNHHHHHYHYHQQQQHHDYHYHHHHHRPRRLHLRHQIGKKWIISYCLALGYETIICAVSWFRFSLKCRCNLLIRLHEYTRVICFVIEYNTFAGFTGNGSALQSEFSDWWSNCARQTFVSTETDDSGNSREVTGCFL